MDKNMVSPITNIFCKLKDNKNREKLYCSFVVIVVDFIWIPITSIILSGIINEQSKGSIKTIIIDINNNSFLIFLLLIVAFVVEGCIRYKKSIIKYFKNNIKNIMIGISAFYISAYVVTLKVVNWWLLILIFLGIIKAFFDSKILSKENKKTNINTMKEYVCESCDELFPNRRKQAERLIKYINSFYQYSRFTILINGKWGTGKTSLIKAIETEMKDTYEVMFIQPMLFDKKELLIKYFCDRLKEVLEKEKIYTGKGSNLESYLISLLNLVNTNAKVGLKDISIDKPSKDFREIKKKLQDDVNRVNNNKRIIVVVDDFDRVGAETKKEILMFIRELIDFDGIDTILLMEYAKLLDKENGLTKEYLDKYIDIRIELNEIEFDEVIKHFIDIEVDNLSSEELNYRQSEKFNDRQLEVIRNGLNILRKNINLIKRCLDTAIYNLEMENYESDKNSEEIIRNKNEIMNIKNDIENFYNNIRLVKKVVRETVNSYKKLQKDYVDEFILEESDIILIFKVNLIKNLFLEEVDAIIDMKDIKSYIENIGLLRNTNCKSKYIQKVLVEIEECKYDEIKNVNRYRISNAIIKYDFDNIIYESKTNTQKIIESIDSKKGNELLKFLLKTEESIIIDDSVVNEIEHIYKLVFSRLQEGDSYKTTIDRIKNLNNTLIEYLKYKSNGVKILLEAYSSISKIYEYYFLSDSLFRDICNMANESNFIEENNKYYELIGNIKCDISVHIFNIIKILIKAYDINKKISESNYFSLERINAFVIKNFEKIMLNKKGTDNNELLKLNLFKILDYMIDEKLIRKYEFDNLKDSINILLESDKLADKFIEQYRGITKNRYESHDERIDIENCDVYFEFKNLANNYIDKFLNRNNFNRNDLNILWGIKNKIEKFSDKEDVFELIRKMKILIDKLEEIKQPNDYNYLEIINLRIGIDCIINNVKY